MKSSTSRWKASLSASRPSPSSCAGVAQEMRRLADQVEADVGERQVDFQHRRMAAPLRQPLAEDQASSPSRSGVVEAAAAAVARHQMCFTPSGIV